MRAERESVQQGHALGLLLLDLIEQVVADTELVTSRKPDDLPAFNKKMIEAFSRSHVAAR